MNELKDTLNKLPQALYKSGRNHSYRYKLTITKEKGNVWEISYKNARPIEPIFTFENHERAVRGHSNLEFAALEMIGLLKRQCPCLHNNP